MVRLGESTLYRNYEVSLRMHVLGEHHRTRLLDHNYVAQLAVVSLVGKIKASLGQWPTYAAVTNRSRTPLNSSGQRRASSG